MWKGVRVSYDQVTVAVAACVCLPRGAFIFGLGYSLRLIKSFIDTAAFTNLLGGHVLDPVASSHQTL